MSKGRVVCDQSDCKLLTMSCDGNKEIVPFRKFKKRKTSRKTKVFKGTGKRRRKGSRKKKMSGGGRKKTSRRKRGKR